MDSPLENALLARLPRQDYQVLFRHLKLMRLRQGQVLFDRGDIIEHVYFPTSALISIMVELDDGFRAEAVMVGKDHVAGAVALGGGQSFLCAEVRSAGYAYRLPVEVLYREFRRGQALMHLILAAIRQSFLQASYASVCGKRHHSEQQVVRWILSCADSTRSDAIAATHVQIAHLIGVRREAVTLALGKLSSQALIDVSRGKIELLDRPGLEEHACECYWAIRQQACVQVL